jgi:hypothetical protein
LSTTGFTIFATPHGFTHIRLLTLHYLAVDRAFTYHLNVFNDIDANFGGTLTNIADASPATRVYTNTINYTILANTIGSNHTKFGVNLSKNNVALYLSSIYNTGASGYGVKYIA